MSPVFAFPGVPLAPSIPSVVPSEFRAGDTVRFTRQFGDYPVADSWAAKLTISGASKASVDGTTSGSEFLFTLTAVLTAQLQPGTYTYAITVTLAGARYTVEEGVLAVRPDVQASTAGSLQSHDEKVLALLEAELEARAASDHTEYQVDGRSLKRESIETLTAWANKVRGRIARRKRGRVPMTAVIFTRPGVIP